MKMQVLDNFIWSASFMQVYSLFSNHLGIEPK